MIEADSKAFLFAGGLTGFGETRLAENLVIRDVCCTADPITLMGKTRSQREYGLLCSLQDQLTFEVEIAGREQGDAAIIGWNFQWALCFLSIITDSYVIWPFGGSCSLADVECPDFYLTNSFLFPSALSEPRVVAEEDLRYFKENLDSFQNLVGNNAFSTAVSIAAVHSHTPQSSIAMATIWSGIEGILGFDHELRFRISLALSHVLEDSPEERVNSMKKFAKLYDCRSKSVHGARTPKNLAESVEQSAEILRKLILKVVERKEAFSREYWDRFFVDEIK